jgi:D123
MTPPRGSATWIENWPAELAALSMPHVGRPLNLHEVETLIDANRSGRCETTRLAALGEWLDAALSAMPGGGFIRLGSRSPKDTALALMTGIKAEDAPSALALLCAGSRRMLHDLSACRDAGYAPWVFVRAWRDIDPRLEFRCFIDGGELVGISTCHGGGVGQVLLPEDLNRFLRATTALSTKISATYRQNAFVADIYFDFASAENPLLIEVNPWGPPTDPCLFDWHEPFDASFRCIGPDGTLRVISMAAHTGRPAADFVPSKPTFAEN